MFGFRLGNLVVTLAMRAKGEEMKWMNQAMEIATQSKPGFPHSPMWDTMQNMSKSKPLSSICGEQNFKLIHNEVNKCRHRI